MTFTGERNMHAADATRVPVGARPTISRTAHAATHGSWARARSGAVLDSQRGERENLETWTVR
jgi:hypothetical protein